MSSTAPARGVAALLTLVLLATAACTTREVERPRPAAGGMAGMAPMLSVERFLQAANARDFDAMARLFGTHEGPIEGDRREIELQMATIAEILRHDDYQVVSERQEPGRVHRTTRVGVTLQQGQRVVRDVPFMVVRTEDGGWLVQEIDLEMVMGS